MKTNKYQKWYDQLIERARTRTLTGYVEKHHVLPRSLGGTDDPDNIVKLTAREHLIAHMLLPKFHEGQFRYKMIKAAMILATYEGNQMNSRVYQSIRESFAQEQSREKKGKKPAMSGWNKGKKMSEEYCNKLSAARKGHKLSPEHVQKIVKNKTGKPNLSKGKPRPSMRRPWSPARRAAQALVRTQSSSLV